MLVGTTFAIISGQVIKVFRDHAKGGALSQSDIAKALDTSVMSVSRFEKGTGELSVSDLEQLAQFFDVKPDAFLNIMLNVKNLLVQQGCVILPNKHKVKGMKEFKKLDRSMIYEICKKIALPHLPA